MAADREKLKELVNRVVADLGADLDWVHLFVRHAKKITGSGAPFVYCGAVQFVGWEGDAPITVRWRLPEPVPPALREALGVPPA